MLSLSLSLSLSDVLSDVHFVLWIPRHSTTQHAYVPRFIYRHVTPLPTAGPRTSFLSRAQRKDVF